jgi:glycopeptide antibiotics resistance protein
VVHVAANKRAQTLRYLRLAGYVLFAAYLLTLLWASLNPEPIDGSGPIRAFVAWVLNFTAASKDWAWLGYNQLESLANVLLYIPLGLGLALIVRRAPWWLDVLIGVAITASAELAQFYFLPDRFATEADVLANSIGVLIGVISARSTLALRSQLRARGSAKSAG